MIRLSIGRSGMTIRVCARGSKTSGTKSLLHDSLLYCFPSAFKTPFCCYQDSAHVFQLASAQTAKRRRQLKITSREREIIHPTYEMSRPMAWATRSNVVGIWEVL